MTSDKPGSCLTVAGNTTSEEKGFTYIVGSLRNDCEHKVGHVTIAFKVDLPSASKFNTRDVNVFAYANDVQPGETRPFKTTFHIQKNATFRFDGIKAF